MRSTEVALRLSPLLILTPASMISSQWCSSTSSARTDGGHENWVSDGTWVYTRSAITALGPAFVKLGQWIATRRDIFPPNVCDRLSVLHDRGVTHAWKHTHAALVDAFGENYVEQGLDMDQNSILIGCGSAAQVYCGTLVRKDNDKIVRSPVAVKVLHPRMGERVERDLYFVQTLANWLHALPMERIQLLNLPRAVENFGTLLLRQADLQIEAQNLLQFRTNFYHSNTDENDSAIVFPQPREGWISKHVLVEDLVSNAIPISEYLKDSTEQGIQIRKELASPLLRAFLKMVFLDNFVHCDLHPGNVLIQTFTTTRPNPPPLPPWWSAGWWGGRNNIRTHDDDDDHTITKHKIVFLDAGIAMSLTPNDQRNLHDLFRAVILNEGNEAGRLMVKRAQYERCSQIPGGMDAFAAGIEDLVSEFHVRRKDGLTLGAVRIGSLLSRVLDLCRVHGVEIDPNMSGIVISTLVLEGLGRSLEPELNLMDFAVPFVLGRGRV
jgi:aarF domain-containing kinase